MCLDGIIKASSFISFMQQKNIFSERSIMKALEDLELGSVRGLFSILRVHKGNSKFTEFRGCGLMEL